jgi:hypothetical protein
MRVSWIGLPLEARSARARSLNAARWLLCEPFWPGSMAARCVASGATTGQAEQHVRGQKRSSAALSPATFPKALSRRPAVRTNRRHGSGRQARAQPHVPEQDPRRRVTRGCHASGRTFSPVYGSRRGQLRTAVLAAGFAASSALWCLGVHRRSAGIVLAGRPGALPSVP